jgi:hypothetical protein
MKLYILLFGLIYSFTQPGLGNKKYNIDSYFGSFYNSSIFNLVTSLYETFINDYPVIVYWSNGLFYKGDDVWIADRLQHTVKLLTNGKVLIAAGITDNPGYRDGDPSNARLNGSSSVVIHNGNQFPANRTINYIPYLLSNTSSECLNASKNNITNCVNTKTDIDIDKNMLFMFDNNTNKNSNTTMVIGI